MRYQRSRFDTICAIASTQITDSTKPIRAATRRRPRMTRIVRTVPSVMSVTRAAKIAMARIQGASSGMDGTPAKGRRQ